MNIVFIGMRGSGKTTIGKAVAKKLAREFVEMDHLVAKKAGMPISEIVEKHGWDYFRDLESEVTKQISRLQNVVISAGGGIVTKPENITNLRNSGLLILLIANVNTLLERIGDDPNRPYVTGKKTRKEDMQEMLNLRKKAYLESADKIVDTNNKTVDVVASDVLVKLKERGIK